MVLVTGGTGLLGGHLLLELVRQNQPVKVLIRKGGDPYKVFSVWKHYESDPGSLIKKISWIPVDLTDKMEVLDALQDVKEIYHCAAHVSFNPKDRTEMYQINVEATRNMVNACLAVGNIRMLYVSSIAAIGKSDEHIATEDDGWPSKSNSIYSRTKTLGELEVWRGITEGLEAIIINPSVILGPGNWSNSSARIFDVIYKGLNYFTLGETGYVDVLDVVRIMKMLMKSTISGERFILNAENLSYKSLFDMIAEAFNLNPPQKYANPVITSFAWRAESIKQFLSGIEPRITKQSARTAHNHQRYSSAKIQNTLETSFLPVKETIKRITGNYLSETQLRNRN